METIKQTNWQSGDKTIQRSIHHDGLFIINHADGSFHTVTSSNDLMKRKYPENEK